MALSALRNRLRAVLPALIFAARIVRAAFTQRPLRSRHIGTGRGGVLTPTGDFLPALIGADDGPAGAGDDGGDKGDKGKKPEPGKDDKGEPDDEDDPVKGDDDWKQKSRKNETRAKKAERERDEAAKKLSEREEADQSESEKAVSAAEKKGREEAESKADKQRRADRLEVAVTRLASKKLKIGDGDDAEEVRFADTEDALIHIERAIDKGEIDPDDIFDKEGNVQTDALRSELAQLLGRKPHLKEADAEGRRSPGSPDSRKGDPAKNDLESMTPEDHARRKYSDGK